MSGQSASEIFRLALFAVGLVIVIVATALADSFTTWRVSYWPIAGLSALISAFVVDSLYQNGVIDCD